MPDFNYELAFWLVLLVAVLLLVLLLLERYDRRGTERFLNTALNAANDKIDELREREAFARWAHALPSERTRIPPTDPSAHERKTIGM